MMKMKKILFALAATAGMLFASSCAKEAVEPIGTGEPVQVSFNVGFDNALATRAIADGTGTDILYYQVFDESSTPVGAPESTEVSSSMTASVTLSLISGKEYQVAFWAQNSKCTAYNLEDLSAVTVDYKSALNNDETRDAFCKAISFTVGSNNPAEAVTLTRPFAQINVGAQEFGDLNITKSQMVVGANSIYSTYNILTGEPEDLVAEEVTFAANDIITDETLDVKDQKYLYMSMSYLLVKQELTTLSFIFFNEDSQVLKLDVENVTIESNHRTNLLGSALSEDVELEVIVDAGMGTNGDKDNPEQPFEEPIPTASLSLNMLTDASGFNYIPVAYGTYGSDDYTSLNDVPLAVNYKITLDMPVKEDVTFNVAVETGQSVTWEYPKTVTVAAGQTSASFALKINSREQLIGDQSTTVTISNDSGKVTIEKESERFNIDNKFELAMPLTAENFACPFEFAEEGTVAGLCDNDQKTYLSTYYWDIEAFTTYATEIATYGVYVDINLPQEVAAIKFKYQNREGNARPTGVKIGAEISGEYQVIGEKTDGLDSANLAWNTLDYFTCSATANKFRFGVTKSITQDETDLTTTPKGQMTLAELQVASFKY